MRVYVIAMELMRSRWKVGGLRPSTKLGVSLPLNDDSVRGCLHFASTASSDSVDSLATLTIRQLDEKTKTRLRVRAAHHGRSMEEEAREILRSALTTSSPAKGNLAEAIRQRFAAFGGIKLQPSRRDPIRHVPGFDE